MALSIQQASTYMGDDRWRWSVWLIGPDHELDAVDHVTYILHPTFLEPVREISDRKTNFRLDTTGWGTFTILAKVILKDDREELLQHELVLVYPDGTPTTA